MSTNINVNELIFVGRLRIRVSDAVPQEKLQDDHYLHRWLVARDFDLAKAELMLREHIAWAKRNEIASILEWKPQQNYFRYGFLGHDNEWNPVFLFPLGLYDLAGVLRLGDIVTAGRAVLRILERIEHEVRLSVQRFKIPGRQAILILDFQKLAYCQVTNKSPVQCITELLALSVANYPELLKAILMVNTPRIFQGYTHAFAIAKPFISARTMHKIEFCSHKRGKWTEALGKRLPLEILPPYYGGKRKGNDQYCSNDSSIWNDGEPLPANYFETGSSLQHSNSDLINETDSIGNWTKNEIPAGTVLNLEFRVSVDPIIRGSSKQLLKWQIKSEDYDIGLRVTFKGKELIKSHRIDSHVQLNEGSLICENSGIYTVTLDNSYSKRRKKIVMYNIYLSHCISE